MKSGAIRPAPEGPKPKGKPGRPVGSMTRLAREAIDKAQGAGMLPHEFLLAISQGRVVTRRIPHPDPDKAADGITVEIAEEYGFPERMDAAKAAAPYYAPKISTVEVIHGVSDEQLDEFIARAAAEAGVSLGAVGEGEEGESEEREERGRRRVE